MQLDIIVARLSQTMAVIPTISTRSITETDIELKNTQGLSDVQSIVVQRYEIWSNFSTWSSYLFGPLKYQSQYTRIQGKELQESTIKYDEPQ